SYNSSKFKIKKHLKVLVYFEFGGGIGLALTMCLASFMAALKSSLNASISDFVKAGGFFEMSEFALCEIFERESEVMLPPLFE
ncbi:hypothetical protein ACNPQK_24300, partial [Acinetobacter guillouiae]|uniref:hypothetical protein n=1 Tax=Acinetobacter guillouiae TaxID=106649 RepID=UPI003AF97643